MEPDPTYVDFKKAQHKVTTTRPNAYADRIPQVKNLHKMAAKRRSFTSFCLPYQTI